MDKWAEKREGLRDGGRGRRRGGDILEIIHSKANAFVFSKALDKGTFMWRKKELLRGNAMLRDFYNNKNTTNKDYSQLLTSTKEGDSSVSPMSHRPDKISRSP